MSGWRALSIELVQIFCRQGIVTPLTGFVPLRDDETQVIVRRKGFCCVLYSVVYWIIHVTANRCSVVWLERPCSTDSGASPTQSRIPSKRTGKALEPA
eukprot:4650476-Pleurochrysis_carterae.AAC.3